MIGADGGLLPEPVDVTRLRPSPGEYAGADTSYMFHCHLLRHEEQG